MRIFAPCATLPLPNDWERMAMITRLVSALVFAAVDVGRERVEPLVAERVGQLVRAQPQVGSAARDRPSGEGGQSGATTIAGRLVSGRMDRCSCSCFGIPPPCRNRTIGH